MQTFDIGISLRPAARGQGHGSRAQHLLAAQWCAGAYRDLQSWSRRRTDA